MKAIALDKDHLWAIRIHAETSYPDECCGLLLGKLSDETKIVREVWPAENAWKTAAPEYWPEQQELTEGTRYAITAEMMLKAMKEGRSRSLAIVGIYHSHNDQPAIPSTFDRTYAWPEYSYIIISVQQGKAQDICNWALDSEGNFQPEEILTIM